PIVWLDTSDCHFEEDQLSENLSRINKEEADLLISSLQSYIEKVSKERVLDEQIDFGLISPYKSQVQYLRRQIKRNGFFKPFRKLITVHTVDGFQGQERDVIMISLVRANDQGQIGFLHDLRRMNVAITRARMKLIILGDASTLTRHKFYKALFNYIQEQGNQP
ncbi:MAG: helicase, partial [Parabacteroides sp.]|nr:helicase [Parabacteroides sp.]